MFYVIVKGVSVRLCVVFDTFLCKRSSSLGDKQVHCLRKLQSPVFFVGVDAFCGQTRRLMHASSIMYICYFNPLNSNCVPSMPAISCPTAHINSTVLKSKQATNKFDFIAVNAIYTVPLYLSI